MSVLLVPVSAVAGSAILEVLAARGHQCRMVQPRLAFEVVGVSLPSVVLITIGQESWSGHALAERLLAAYAGLRLIALSPFSSEADLEQAREAGFDEIVVTPVDPDALMRAIAGGGGERGSEAEEGSSRVVLRAFRPQREISGVVEVVPSVIHARREEPQRS